MSDFIPKGWPKESERPGYTPTPADLTDEQDELTGAHPDFATLKAAEAARTEQDGKSLLPAKPTERARIRHDGSQLNQFAKNGWSVKLHDGSTITAVEKGPASGTDPNIVQVRDSDGTLYISIPGRTTLFAKHSDVVAAYPNLNLMTATKKFLGLS